MSYLKLGTHSLFPTDVELIRLLVRLYGQRGRSKWAFAEAPPYDAILIDASSPGVSPMEVERSDAAQVLRLTRATGSGQQPTDALPRPLQPNDFQDCLDRLGDVVRSTSGMPLKQAEPAPAPLPAEAPASTQPAPDAPRFRLQRWPRKGILRDENKRIRMATLLSRRPLNTYDLVRLTGFSTHDCEVFMQILHASGLLMADTPPTVSPETVPVQARTSDTPDTHARTVAAAPPSPARPRFAQGLIAGLRKRLGLNLGL